MPRGRKPKLSPEEAILKLQEEIQKQKDRMAEFSLETDQSYILKKGEWSAAATVLARLKTRATVTLVDMIDSAQARLDARIAEQLDLLESVIPALEEDVAALAEVLDFRRKEVLEFRQEVERGHSIG